MFQKAQWIWDSSGDRRRRNSYVLFRKPFFVEDEGRKHRLRITADAQYWVWVNGICLGSGPIRSFAPKAFVDEIELNNVLEKGGNHLCVLVHSLGISTFRYILSDAGLIAEICAEDEVLLGTDSSWECFSEPFGRQKEFRISCQQGWLEPEGVSLGEFSELMNSENENWKPCVVVSHERELLPAPVGLSDQEEVYARSVWRNAIVMPPKTIWRISLRSSLLPGYFEAAPKHIKGVVKAVFHVKHPGEIQFELPAGWFWSQAKIYLNGEPMVSATPNRVPFENGLAFVGRVNQGENVAHFELDGSYHEWTLSVTCDGAALELTKPFEVAPNKAFDEVFEEDFEEIPAECVDVDSVFARTAYAKVVRELEQGNPEEVYLESQGEGLEHSVILDLGRMTVGRWRFEVEATHDTRLIFNGFESIQEGVTDYCWEMSNTWEADVKAGHSEFASLIRRGARYVQIQGESAVVKNFRVKESTFPSISPAKFECAEDKLSRIHEMSALTLRLCTEDTFVDCPTYEQTFWVGDARNEALVNAYLYGDYALMEHMWCLAGESLDRSPLVESHVPSGWPVIIPAWSFLWSLACWEHYEITGNKDFLKKIYPLMLKQAENALEFLNTDGLFEVEAWNLTDWAPMSQPHKGVNTPNQGWLCMALEATAKAGESLGDTVSSVSLRTSREDIAAAVRHVLWNFEKKSYTDCIEPDTGKQSEVFSLQTQCVLALAGIPDEDQAQRIYRLLTGIDDSLGFVQSGTPFFDFFILEYFERHSEFKKMLEYMKSRWGMMLERGATTCWELYPGYMPNGRWTRSHCHAWSSGPAYFLLKHLLGVIPVGTEKKKILFQPKTCDLTYCSGAVCTTKGAVFAKWWIEGGEFLYEVNAPNEMEVVTDLSYVLT